MDKELVHKNEKTKLHKKWQKLKKQKQWWEMKDAWNFYGLLEARKTL